LIYKNKQNNWATNLLIPIEKTLTKIVGF